MGYEDHSDEALVELLESWKRNLADVERELLRRGKLRRRSEDRITAEVSFLLVPEMVPLEARSIDISPGGMRALLEGELHCQVDLGQEGGRARLTWASRNADGTLEVGLQYVAEERNADVA